MRSRDLAFERPPDRQATSPPEARGLERDGVRLLVSARDRHEHATFRDLPRFLPPGAVLVVNRSATLPASLPARGSPGDFLLNLSTDYGDGLWLAEPRWDAETPGPLPLARGEEIVVAGLPARVGASHPGLPRLRFVRIEGDVGAGMARHGQPIRYGYLEPPFPPLEAYQTVFSDRAGSAEMPSAARPFTKRVVDALRAKGIHITKVVLHTGVSSIEVETDVVEDHALYAEPFAVPAETAEAVTAARAEGRPVIAVGTTVVRALESARDGQRVRPTVGFTRRFVHPGHPVHVVDGLLTGLHDPHASHLAMLFALADQETVRVAYGEAVSEGYLWHEFGDSHLILPTRLAPGLPRAPVHEWLEEPRRRPAGSMTSAWGRGPRTTDQGPRTENPRKGTRTRTGPKGSAGRPQTPRRSSSSPEPSRTPGNRVPRRRPPDRKRPSSAQAVTIPPSRSFC